METETNIPGRIKFNPFISENTTQWEINKMCVEVMAPQSNPKFDIEIFEELKRVPTGVEKETIKHIHRGNIIEATAEEIELWNSCN